MLQTRHRRVDRAAGQDSERVRLIHQEIQAEQTTIAQLYEHWEEANERN